VQNRFREERAQRGISQAEIATVLGVSPQTVISIENGRYAPSLPLAFRIARFFDPIIDKMSDRRMRWTHEQRQARPPDGAGDHDHRRYRSSEHSATTGGAGGTATSAR
jgi:putative transcriptional regulator